MIPTMPRPSAVTDARGWRVAFLFAPRWPAYLLGALVAVGLVAGLRMVWGFLIAAVIGVSLERLFPRHDQPVLRRGLRTDVVHFLFTHFLQLVAVAVPIGICYLVLRPFTIAPARDWIAARPVLVQWALGSLLLTFLLYWYHRWSHEVPFLWRFHAVHHSPAQLDWVAAARVHPLEFFFGGFLLAPPLLLLGFDPAVIGLFAGVETAWAVVVHANVRWRLRWMDRLYASPEYHHWHHSLEPDAIDKNFGLPLWDTLFGTYFMPRDRRPARYGIAEPMPATYLGQMMHPFRPRRG